MLHVIYGNGIRDTTIDRSVRAVKPSWRADSLAFAYVGGGGRAVLYDVGHESRQVVGIHPPVTTVAFAPSGDALALEGPKGVSLVNRSAHRHITGANVEALGWLNGRLAVAVPGLNSALIRMFAPDGAARGSSQAHGIVKAITPKLVVVQRGRAVRPCATSRSASAARPRSRRSASPARSSSSTCASASRPRAP